MPAQDSPKTVVVKKHSRLVTELALLFWHMITRVFFREIRLRGAFNIPRDGPVIFVGAPHSNQFLDPLLLVLEVHRESRRLVQFLTAAASMKRRFIGFFSRLMDSIPVVRAADNAKKGTGLVSLSPDDPCLVIGHGTKFTTEFSPKTQIMLPKTVNTAVAEVDTVISDTEMRIKREFGGESGKTTNRIREKVTELQAAGTQGLEYKTMPWVDQQEMYHHVYQCLKEGGCIGIFPEGGSHDRTDLLPLKAGVSMMALGAMANEPHLSVKVVPVGLSYFHPHRFRSRAVVEFGAPLDVPAEFVNMYKEGGTRKREAVSKMLDLIYDALKTVTVRAPDYDTLMLIQAVRRLYKTPGQHLTLGQVVELNRRFLEAYEHFKNEPRIQDLRKDVLKYNRLVRDLGLRDHQVPRAEKASWKTAGLLTYRLGLLIVWAILALPGTVLNSPMFILASIMSRRKAKEALAASTVKVAGKDVLATWKILISLGVAPVVYTIYAIMATLIAYKAGVPLKWRVAMPFLTLTVLPMMNYASLKFGEAGMDVLKSLRPLIVALIPGQQRSLNKLKEMRVRLSNEVAAVINDYGPQLYDDFNEFRILVPSATAPPSTGTPGIWRRRSAEGAIDAQGGLLAHPMTWLDERLFGWSRSAKNGTSVWGGHSTDVSHRGTPNETDDEDHPDYDNVLGYFPDALTSPLATKSRSRTSSYADLQRLRMSGAPTVSPMDGEGLRGRRRKNSLSDNIPVQHIAEVNATENFKEATDDLNAEVKKKRHE